MDKKHRRMKKRIKRNAEALADKIPLAFKNETDKRSWINDIVRNHPAVKS